MSIELYGNRMHIISSQQSVCSKLRSRGQTRICKLLVEKGGDVNVKDAEHHTPIHLARCSAFSITRYYPYLKPLK